MQKKDQDFMQIKRELIERVEAIEAYIADGVKQRERINTTLDKLNLKINGDEDSVPPKKGIDDRLRDLETIEGSREKTKTDLSKIAVGSLTMAVGGAVIWILNVIKDAFIKGGH